MIIPTEKDCKALGVHAALWENPVSCAGLGAALVRNLRPLLNPPVRIKRKRRRAGRVHSPALAGLVSRYDTRVFSTSPRVPTKSVAFAVSCDVTYSMMFAADREGSYQARKSQAEWLDSRMAIARCVVSALWDVADKLRVPMATFVSDKATKAGRTVPRELIDYPRRVWSRWARESVAPLVTVRLQDFGRSADRRLLGALGAHNNMDCQSCVNAAGEALTQRPEKRKILIVLTDGGLPGAGIDGVHATYEPVGGMMRLTRTSGWVGWTHKMRAAGIVPVFIGIGRSPGTVADIPNAVTVACHDARTLPGEVARVIRSLV